MRPLQVPADLAPWLALRERTFAQQRPSVGPWTESDFRRELSGKPWWRPDRCWVVDEPLQSGTLIASATLAIVTRHGANCAAVHWLMVDPDWRRRGLGKLLMQQLEHIAWNAGFREVHVETHSGWTAAVALYEKLGYRATS